jgi:hypothetical protein
VVKKEDAWLPKEEAMKTKRAAAKSSPTESRGLRRNKFPVAALATIFIGTACQSYEEVQVPVLEVPDLVDITVPIYNADNPPPSIAQDKSLLVTSRANFASVENRFTLGKLLSDRNAFMQAYVQNNYPQSEWAGLSHKRQSGTLHPFEGGRTQVDDHNDAPDASKLGEMKTIKNTFQDRILDVWNVGTDPNAMADEDGPFRLLAVVNRMDLSGEVDGRGLGDTFAEDQRKWFGEGRLVFGLKDGDASHPMTLIAEYRLPALKQVSSTGTTTTFAVDENFDHAAGPGPTNSNAKWLDGRERWARVWRELSNPSLTTAEYKDRLYAIVTLFARPENIIALRTGEQVRDKTTNQPDLVEFEYREFYTNGGFALARRHNRREPVFCAGGGSLLKDIITEEWTTDTANSQYDYKLGPNTFNPSDGEQGKIDQLLSDCGGTAPFGASEDAKGGGLSLRAAFARFKPDQVWPALPSGGDSEAKRHSMAVGSCSGCHSAETGTSGFHISPRSANADSVVSPFLSGSPYTVNIGGTDYTYNEIDRRKQLMLDFYERVDIGNQSPTNTVTREILKCTQSPCEQLYN